MVGLARKTHDAETDERARERIVKELWCLQAQTGALYNETARFEGRHPRHECHQFVARVAPAGDTDLMREIFELDEPAELRRRLAARPSGVFTFTEFALRFAAAHQLERAPMYLEHDFTGRVRPQHEAFGFIDHAWFDVMTLSVFARVNVRVDAVQRRFSHALAEGVALPLSMQFQPFMSGFDVELFEQVHSVDLVTRAACSAARILGLWSDRCELLKELGAGFHGAR